VSLLRNVPFFGDLTEAQLSKVAECLAPEEHAPGAPIITKGDIGDCFYMLRSGTALVTDGPGKLLATVQQGGFFGERALLNDDVRAAHVSVAPDGESALCFVLRRDAFKAALAMVEETFRCGSLSSMPLLAPLAPQQLAAAAGDMKRVVRSITTDAHKLCVLMVTGI
jgi:CRP-like cAMP-binding protein